MQCKCSIDAEVGGKTLNGSPSLSLYQAKLPLKAFLARCHSADEIDGFKV